LEVAQPRGGSRVRCRERLLIEASGWPVATYTPTVVAFSWQAISGRFATFAPVGDPLSRYLLIRYHTRHRLIGGWPFGLASPTARVRLSNAPVPCVAMKQLTLPSARRWDGDNRELAAATPLATATSPASESINRLGPKRLFMPRRLAGGRPASVVASVCVSALICSRAWSARLAATSDRSNSSSAELMMPRLESIAIAREHG
jgi:hypothetical protein